METHARTIAKAISWRILASLITSVLVWKVTGECKIGISVGILDCLIKLFTYYFHERAWNAIPFGYSSVDKPARAPLELVGSLSADR